MKQYIWSAVAGTALFVASIAAGMTAATADNLVPTGNARVFCSQSSAVPIGVCQTDNAGVYWHMAVGTQALEKVDRQALRQMLKAQFASPETDLVLHYEKNPVFAGPAETDWIYQEGEIDTPGTIGRTWCNDKVATWECDQHYIKLEPKKYLNPKVTCHETGHATGLTHGSEANPVLEPDAAALGCLRAPLSAITSNALGSSNKSQINQTY